MAPPLPLVKLRAPDRPAAHNDHHDGPAHQPTVRPARRSRAQTAPHQAHFPERTLARRLGLHGYPATVYAFPQVGVQPLRAAYRALIDLHRIGAVVLVDGGTFGDVHFTDRTRGSELFVNPLMSLCFAFDLPGPAARCLYMDRIEHTHLMRRVHSEIAAFREETITGPARRIPH